MPAFFARAFALAAFAGLTGCADVTEERNEHVLAELRARERTWNGASVKNYSMVIVRRCAGCPVQIPGPVRVEVANGVVVGQVLTATGTPVSDAAKPLVPGVEGLFAELKQTFSQEWRSMAAEYDAVLGYPVRVRVDFDRTDGSDDLSIDVTNFVRN